MNSALRGKSIVITRALAQSDEFTSLLQSRGALPIAYPCIAIAPPADTTPLDRALDSVAAGAYDWLIFTSGNTALALAERLKAQKPQQNRPLDTVLLKIAAVGAATAQTIQDSLGLPINLVPQDYNADATTDALVSALPQGARVLLPQSEIANPTLRQRLTDIGAAVTTVTAYRTVIGSGGADVPALLCAGKVDAITFTSPSTVENFLRRLQVEGGDREHLEGVTIACIGKTTARAAEALGLQVSVISTLQTIDALTDALENHFAVERL